MRYYYIRPSALQRIICCVLLCMAAVTVSARCGGTDYSWGSSALYYVCAFFLSFMNVIGSLLNVIAVLLGLYSATVIYIKLEMGDAGFAKSVSMLIGSFVFLMAEMIILPSFFGFNYVDGGFSDDEILSHLIWYDIYAGREGERRMD